MSTKWVGCWQMPVFCLSPAFSHGVVEQQGAMVLKARIVTASAPKLLQCRQPRRNPPHTKLKSINNNNHCDVVCVLSMPNTLIVLPSVDCSSRDVRVVAMWGAGVSKKQLGELADFGEKNLHIATMSEPLHNDLKLAGHASSHLDRASSQWRISVIVV